MTHDEFDVFNFFDVSLAGEQGESQRAGGHAALVKIIDLVSGPENFLAGRADSGRAGVGDGDRRGLKIARGEEVVVLRRKIEAEGRGEKLAGNVVRISLRKLIAAIDAWRHAGPEKHLAAVAQAAADCPR